MSLSQFFPRAAIAICVTTAGAIGLESQARAGGASPFPTKASDSTPANTPIFDPSALTNGNLAATMPLSDGFGATGPSMLVGGYNYNSSGNYPYSTGSGPTSSTHNGTSVSEQGGSVATEWHQAINNTLTVAARAYMGQQPNGIVGAPSGNIEVPSPFTVVPGTAQTATQGVVTLDARQQLGLGGTSLDVTGTANLNNWRFDRTLTADTLPGTISQWGKVDTSSYSGVVQLDQKIGQNFFVGVGGSGWSDDVSSCLGTDAMLPGINLAASDCGKERGTSFNARFAAGFQEQSTAGYIRAEGYSEIPFAQSGILKTGSAYGNLFAGQDSKTIFGGLVRGSYDVTNLKVSFNVDGTTAYGGSLRAAILFGDKGDKFAMGPTFHDDYAQKAYGLAVQTKLYSAIIRAEGLRLDDRTPLGARLEGWGVQVVVAYRFN